MNVTETSQRLMKNMTPQQVENALRKAQGPRGVSKSYKNSSNEKGKKKSSHDPITTSNKNTRPLNSYMAFRSYYSILFSSIQQKEISGLVTYMWQEDPFKAKWTILAKAYSAIRDNQGKVNAPLDDFLAINAPPMGIIEPQHYLRAFGWKFVLEADGQVMIQRGETFFDSGALSPGLSVNGVIAHCYMKGYFTGSLTEVMLVNDETAVMVTNEDTSTRATGGTPGHSNIQSGNNGDVNGNQNSTHNTTVAIAPNVQASFQQDNTVQMQGSVQASTIPTDAVVDADHASSSSMPIEQNLLTTTDAAQTMAPSPQSEALYPSNFMLPPSEFALDEAFDPLLYDEQDVFDPFEGNQFDAFDWMDGWDAYVNTNALTS